MADGKPFEPYEGAEPYVFVSYSHKDSARVLPILAAMRERGYRVWYDKGIPWSSEWPAVIEEHLRHCGVCLAFHSKTAIESVHCRREIHYALHEDKPIFSVYLESVKLRHGLALELSLYQFVKISAFHDIAEFVERLNRESAFAPCKITEEAERKAREEAERWEAERKAQEDAERREEERKAKEEAERREAKRKRRQEVKRKAREETERLKAERKAQEEAERREAERKAQEEAERQEAERKAQEDAERQEAERKAQEEAERKRRKAAQKERQQREQKRQQKERKRQQVMKWFRASSIRIVAIIFLIWFILLIWSVTNINTQSRQQDIPTAIPVPVSGTETGSGDSVSTSDSWVDEETLLKKSAETLQEHIDAYPTTLSFTIAVLDTGIDMDNPAFDGRLVSGYDFVDDDETPQDENGHGTGVAGIIVENTANNVKIMPVRTLNSFGAGKASIIAEGIRYAVDNGANVICFAAGGAHNQGKHEAFQYAVDQGVTVVASAGTNGGKIGDNCPAHMEECLIVASVGESLERSEFSSYGATVDLCAPGEHIRVYRLGGNVLTKSGGGYSAAYAAAAVVNVMEEYRTILLPAEVETILKDAARDLGDSGWDPYYGAGLVDMYWFFYGRKR